MPNFSSPTLSPTGGGVQSEGASQDTGNFNFMHIRHHYRHANEMRHTVWVGIIKLLLHGLPAWSTLSCHVLHEVRKKDYSAIIIIIIIATVPDNDTGA